MTDIITDETIAYIVFGIFTALSVIGISIVIRHKHKKKKSPWARLYDKELH
jgi:hypothetical protein